MDRKEVSITEIYPGAQENREYEFKPSFTWRHPTPQSLELIKTMVSMFNSPSGGTIIYGIKQNRNDSRIEYTGLSQENIESFEINEEKIKRIINSYTSLYIAPNFALILDKELDKAFMTISIQRFHEYATVIKKDGYFEDRNGVKIDSFKIGDILTRSMHPPYSSKKVSQEELNEMIELCAKGVEKKARYILNLEDTEQVKNSIEEDLIKVKLKEERKDEYGI